MSVNTIQELWQFVMKDEVPGSEAYYDAEYHMGQAISLYGADLLIKEHNEREAIFDGPFNFLVPANGIGVGPPADVSEHAY